MPNLYENASGVSELKARYVVLDALKSGWRLAKNGELPMDVPVEDKCFSVFHIVRKRVHLVLRGQKVTMCKMWCCGTPEYPERNCSYDVDDCHGYDECKVCGNCTMGHSAFDNGARGNAPQFIPSTGSSGAK